MGAGVRSRGLMQGQRLRCQGVGEGDAGGWRKQGQIRISCMPMCRTLLQNTCHVRAAVALTGLYMQESSRHLISSVEVFEVISIDIGGGDVCSASKPPLTWNPVPLLRLKVPAG